MGKIHNCIILMALLALANICGAGTVKAAAIKVVFDTDMSSDCDDVGALAVLNALADSGDAEILACVLNGHDQDKAAAASISTINTYYGRTHLPIGTYQGSDYPPTKSRYTAHLRDEFPHSALPDDQEPKAVDVYRAALASAPDGSVTIISVGFLVNLEELLQSSPDANSALKGAELVSRKVQCLVGMGGRFPKSEPGKAEYNFAGRGGSLHTRSAIENWPTPILFTGYEIGQPIQTGTKLAAAPVSNPVRRAYELHTSFKGRSSWDLTAVLAAVRDPSLSWNIESSGYCKVNADGTNEWVPASGHNHRYLVVKTAPDELASVLDGLLAQPPTVSH